MNGPVIAPVEMRTPKTEYLRETVDGPYLLKGLDPKAQSVAGLFALLELVKERNRFLPDEDAVRACLGRMSQQQIEDFARVLRLRLVQETTVLDSLLDEGLDPFAPDLREIELPYRVQHVTSKELQEINPFHREVGACYRGGTIYVGPDLPGLRERVANLATRGILSNDLFHEVYHGHQDGDVHYASLDDVLHSLMNPHAAEWKLALAESHAWLACLRGFKDEVLMPVIQTSYEIGKAEYIERSFKVINSLNALGVNDKQVGALIGQTHWDDETGHYAVLEPELRRLMDESGHTEESLEEEVEKRKLVERIQALRAMGIAAEICAS